MSSGHLNADWNLAGAAQDVALFRDMGMDLANSRAWPGWKPGSEFKAVREKSRDARGE
jgi:hypothetical protein